MQSALQEYREQLEGDAIVKRHLDDLFKALLEQNLLRIIKPYSKVEVAHLAKLITLDKSTVEREISQMILDKKIAGTHLGLLGSFNDSSFGLRV
jgi:26S proteasome regulatory subunit N6